MALCEGIPVGVLVWHHLATHALAPAWGLISALVVDEGARGGGIGALLLAAAEQRAAAWVWPAGALQQPQARRAHDFIWRKGIASVRKTFVKAV